MYLTSTFALYFNITLALHRVVVEPTSYKVKCGFNFVLPNVTVSGFEDNDDQQFVVSLLH